MTAVPRQQQESQEQPRRGDEQRSVDNMQLLSAMRVGVPLHLLSAASSFWRERRRADNLGRQEKDERER
jgi:hypothetical protein